MKDPTKTAQHSVIVELQGENGKLREQLRESEAKCATLRSEIEKFRSEEWVSGAEVGVFQDQVRNLIIDLTKCPDGYIDGKGSDAGWEEFTLAEIGQGIAFVIDQRDALASQCQQLREALEHIAHYPVHSEPMGGALDMQDIAEKALKSTPPSRLVSVKELEPTKKMLRELQIALHSVGLHTVANDCGFEADRLERLKDGK